MGLGGKEKMKQLTDDNLIYLEIDVSDPIQIPYRLMRNRVKQVINELRAYKSAVEEIQKTLEQIANTEWHPNADLVNVEIAYEMRALAKEALQSLKEVQEKP